MRDDLLYIYERELTFLRRMGAEFAREYPKVAARLQIEPTKCEDPHVERMLEAFALLAARVHLKLDDDLPAVSEALLNVIYPHYIRPIPSMSTVEIALDPEQGKLTTGLAVPRDSVLYSRPVSGVPCKFRTCYDTTLWPVNIAGAQWTTPDRLKPPVRAADATAALRIDLKCLPDVRFDALTLKTLRLHIAAESTLSYALYELLCNNCVRVLVREPGKARTITLPATALTPVGFSADEGMLPFPGRSFQAYRLLQEYFVFPDKFLFLDIAGFDEVRAAGFGADVELVFLISPYERAERRQVLEAGVDARTFKLGCTPIVNLFGQTSEPVLLTQRTPEYLLVPDARRRLTTEIFSVDEVVAVSPGSPETIKIEPLHALRHAADGAAPAIFWSSTRRPVGWRTDDSSEVSLAFFDRSQRTMHPDADAVTARLTCFNGDLPSRLPFGSDAGDFELEGGGPILAVRALVKPTQVVQPPLGKPQLWRLISQLSLNYLSLADGGVDALRELLRLHNFADSESGERNVHGLLSVKSAPTFAQVSTEHGLGFARGRRIELELDEDEFTGGGAYLFASVLDHFFGLYASMNSFTALTARTTQRRQPMRSWAPRAGWRPLA
ncbi:MAG: type VI secretion system baseplate subunit TssF [Gemmatimonadota bacterium]|nr:type VI secretion system baseplate subunit TssF [Gemmatimonadota bacterium]